MIVETALAGSRSESTTLELAVPQTQLSLRALLDLLVGAELERYQARREDSLVVKILTPIELVRGAETGKYGAEARNLPAAPAREIALERAYEGFADGLFFVFFDGTKVDDLDSIVTVTATSTLRLVRLVALTGR